MARHQEIEDEYDVSELAVLPSLSGLPNVAAVDGPIDQDLEATYYDTPGLRLAAAGITLRHRTGGGDTGWHLKLPAGRGRHEIQVPQGRATTVPKRLRDTLRVIGREESLMPIATIRTRRAVRRLLDDQGQLLAEAADDRVTAQVARRGNEPPGPSTSWREWEVELSGGDEGLISAAGRLFRQAGAKPSTAASKLERTLGRRWPGPRLIPPRSAQDPVATLAQIRLVELVEQLRRRDPFVREDLPDSVHQMRVTTRRLRAALDTFGPFLDRAVTEPVRDELKWLADVLGAARDAEVQGDRLVQRLTKPAEVERGDAAKHAEQSFDELRTQTQQQCLEALKSQRYRTLLRRMDQLAVAPPWSHKASEPVDPALNKRIRKEWSRVERRVAAAAAEDANGMPRAGRLHEARKAVRRVRYAAEPLIPVYGKQARKLVKTMSKIQTVLGDHHDTVVARAQLRDWAAQAAANGHDTTDFTVVDQLEAKAAAKLEAQFEQVWASRAKKVRRRWLP